MELSKLKDAFDIVAKEQKLLFSKTQQVIDQVGREIESAIRKFQSVNSNQKSILGDLKNELSKIAPTGHLEGFQKDIYSEISMCEKLFDEHFSPDILKAYRNVDFDSPTVNQIIATHLYRNRLSAPGACLVRESKDLSGDYNVTLKHKYWEMHRIRDAMKSRNLLTALYWAAMQQGELLKNGSILEVKLRQLKFINILQKPDDLTPGEHLEHILDYARRYLIPVASIYKVYIHDFFTACLLCEGQFEQSAYGAAFLSETNFDKMMEELTEQYCRLTMKHSYESPLSVVVAAGFQGLPSLLKMAADRQQEWQELKKLPEPVDLGVEFQFHPIFVCPVSFSPADAENPPMMLMPCRHVLSDECTLMMPKEGRGPRMVFKCPICQQDSAVDDCQMLRF